MSDAFVNPCRTCGKCCTAYTVDVTGYDIWRIATSQRMRPEQFIRLHGIPDGNNSLGLHLEQSGPLYIAGLDKRGPWQPQSPCVFLVQLPGNNPRCGIYADRPTTCQAYPMTLERLMVIQRSEVLCPDGAWPEARRPAWKNVLDRHFMNMGVYAEVLSRWNARVAAARPGSQFGATEFYDYLMNVYDQLNRLDVSLGEAGRAAVESTWNRDFVVGQAQQTRYVKAGEYPWIDYLLSLKQILERFYPEVESPPMLGGTLRLKTAT